MSRRGVPVRRPGPALLAFAAIQALWAGPALAGELLVQAPVVDVEALGGAADDACQPPRPGVGAGLAELLAWDLRVHCPPSPAASYRVSYRWDGRTYTRVMDHPPGDTVALRVRLR